MPSSLTFSINQPTEMAVPLTDHLPLLVLHRSMASSKRLDVVVRRPGHHHLLLLGAGYCFLTPLWALVEKEIGSDGLVRC